MPASLKAKVEAAATVKYREGPELPASLRNRAIRAGEAEHWSISLMGRKKEKDTQQGTKPGDDDPVGRDELYAKEVDWERMDRGNVLREKIVPWVETQVIMNFGSSIPRLVNLICSKVAHREPPQAIEAELKKVRSHGNRGV